MAQTWEAKAPTEVVVRRWAVPITDADGDNDDEIATVSASASGVTVDSTDYALDEAVVTLSGGTAGTTATVTVTVTTEEGETLVETFLIAIAVTAQQFAYTARDIVNFALRKIVGAGNDPDATEAADALEMLNDLIATWRIDGLDVGIPAPLALSDTVTVPDEFIAALKFNLRVACADEYGSPSSARDLQMADAGRRLVANQLGGLDDLQMPATLTVPGIFTVDNDLD